MIKFKKHMKAGQCNAMRCKEPGEHTYEPGDRPPMLLCPKHMHIVSPHLEQSAQVGATVESASLTVAEAGVASSAQVHEAATAAASDAYANATTWGADHMGATQAAARAATLAAAQPLVVNLPPVVVVPKQTAVVVPHADALALANPMLAEYNEIGPQLVNFVIDSQWGMDTAGALLKEIKGKLKKLEALRKSITQPLLQGKAAVDELFRPARKAGEAVEASLKKSIAAFVDGQRQAQVQALQAGQHATALAVEQPAMPTGVSTTTTWRWRIANAAIIPREYWAIDSVKVQVHVNAHKGQSQIPGIEVYCETGVRSAAS